MKCPKCGKEKDRLLAMSRRNKEAICDECGIIEAMEDYKNACVNGINGDKTCRPDLDDHADLTGNSMGGLTGFLSREGRF